MCFFFQAEDGIRDAQESRGLGDVYKRQEITFPESINIYLKNWSLLFVFSINLFTLDLFELTNQ